MTPGLTLDLDDSDREELTHSSAPLKILGALIRNAGTLLRKSPNSTANLTSKRRLDTVPEGMPDFVDRRISNKREKKMVDSNVTTQAESNQVVKAAIHNLKAARADDAEVPKWMWNDRIDNLLKGRVERTILDKALDYTRKVRASDMGPARS